MVLGALIGMSVAQNVIRRTANMRNTRKRYKYKKNVKLQQNKSGGNKKKMAKGVPKGYKHNWSYHGAWNERKVKTGLWRFKFRATKSRKTARSMGSFGIGTTGAWKINAIQRIRKTGKGQYQTTMTGTKKPLKFKVRKPRKK